jgi:hypothetical protein
LSEVQKVQALRAERASFVHIEIYKDPRSLTVADAVEEWGLHSEPWIYLVGRDGVITDRMESLVTSDELDAALAPLL